MGDTSTLASFAPIAGAGLGLVGSVIGNIQSSKNVNKQIEAQRKENAANRDFNAKQAQLNRDYQTGQILDYRQYNSPLAQVKRLQEAGFHPTAALGQMSSSDVGLSSGSAASSSGGISPVGYSPLDVTSSARTLAETRLLNAQAKEKEASAGNLDSQTITNDALRDGMIATQDLQLQLGTKNLKLTDEEISRIKSDTLRIDAITATAKETLNEIVQRTANLRQDVLSKMLDNIWRSKTLNDRISFEAAKLHLTEFEYKRGVAMLAYDMANSAADTNLKYAQAFQSSSMGRYMNLKGSIDADEYLSFKTLRLDNLGFQNKRLQFDLTQDGRFSTIERGLGAARSFIGTVTDFQNMLLNPAEKGASILGKAIGIARGGASR